jgi:hypothetical protein
LAKEKNPPISKLFIASFFQQPTPIDNKVKFCFGSRRRPEHAGGGKALIFHVPLLVRAIFLVSLLLEGGAQGKPDASRWS